MFSYFSKNFNAKEQEILNDKFLIHINDYTYDIPSEETYKSLLNVNLFICFLTIHFLFFSLFIHVR